MVRDYKLLGRAELTSTLVRLKAEMEDLEETIRFYYLNSAAHINGGEVLRDEETMAELDRKSTRLNSSHSAKSRMPSSA